MYYIVKHRPEKMCRTHMTTHIVEKYEKFYMKTQHRSNPGNTYFDNIYITYTETPPVYKSNQNLFILNLTDQ